MGTPFRNPAFALLLMALAGCTTLPESVWPNPERSIAIEISDTPFFPQNRYQCGPAALATLLVHSGISTSADALVRSVYVPARKGSLQVEMLAATRAAGRLAYPIAPTLDAVIAELEAGRPVLVLQNLGISWIPRWHYAVIVGIDSEDDTVILRSGTDERRRTRTNLFLRTWQRSGFWGFVAVQPGQLPAQPEPARYFNSAADLEATGRSEAAHRAWSAALQRWPDSAVPPFGLANVALSQGQNAAALGWYQETLERSPDHLMARNNMAYALAELGRLDDAIALLESASNLASDASRAAIDESLEELRARALEKAR